jgi:hypothetical protein
MADLVITAADVKAGTNARTADGTAGEALTAGEVLYRDSTDNKIKKADADTSAATATAVGIALHASLDGQPIKYQFAGNITIGAATVVAQTYVLSDTPGGIRQCDDVAIGSGDFTSILGVAPSVTEITLKFDNSGVALA